MKNSIYFYLNIPKESNIVFGTSCTKCSYLSEGNVYGIRETRIIEIPGYSHVQKV